MGLLLNAAARREHLQKKYPEEYTKELTDLAISIAGRKIIEA